MDLTELKAPPWLSAVFKAAWAIVPKEEKDKMVAFALREARAIAWWAFKELLAYAAKRVAEGAPPDTFGDMDAFQQAPPFDMPPGGMSVPGPSDEPTL